MPDPWQQDLPTQPCSQTLKTHQSSLKAALIKQTGHYIENCSFIHSLACKTAEYTIKSSYYYFDLLAKIFVVFVLG